MPTATDIAAALAGYQQPQQTLWVPRTPTVASGATAAIAGTVTPQIGDLMIITWHGNAGTNPFTAVSIGDTGSGGWTAFGTMATQAKMTGQAWYKTATSADFNGGSGITVTVTGSGQSGTISAFFYSDLFLLNVQGGPSYTKTGDLTLVTSSASTTTVTEHPAAGSSQTQTDELSYIGLTTNATALSVTGTNTFKGTTPTRNLIRLADEGIVVQCLRQYAGLNQPNATAANNTWVATWGTAAAVLVTAATFYWTA